MSLSLEEAKKILAKRKNVPIKIPFLENATTYVATDHHPADRASKSDLIIYPFKELRASKNPQDFGFAVKYYPNCDDPFFRDERYKPKDSTGLTYDYENLTEDDITVGNATEGINLAKIRESMQANPKYPATVAYERAKTQCYSEQEARNIQTAKDKECTEYLNALLNSKIALFVKGHPHFSLDIDNLVKYAKTMNFSDFINSLQRSLFNAECMIRVIDPEYFDEMVRCGYNTVHPWAHCSFSINEPGQNYTSKIKKNAKALNERYKLATVTIDKEFTFDYASRTPIGNEPTPYERFLKAYGYLNYEFRPARDR